MWRACLVSTFVVALALAGCTKSEEGQAQRSTGDSKLMPSAKPAFEAEYLADQSTVKTLPARKISYEALDSFRKEEKSADEKPPAEVEATEEEKQPEPRKAPKQVATKTAPAPGGAVNAAPAGAKPGGFWKRVGIKALTGGGRQPPPAKKSKGDSSESSDD